MELPNDKTQVEFSVFVCLYLDAVRHRLRSYRQLRWRMQRFIQLFAGRTIVQISRQDIAAYIDRRLDAGLTNGTINLEVSTLSSAYNFAIKHWGWPLINPVAGQHLKQEEGRLRWLDVQETHRLHSSTSRPRASIHLADFVILAVNTGCRKNELLQLAWRHVDFEAGLIIIESKKSKSGRRRIIPINQSARRALEHRRDFCQIHCPDSPWVFAKKNGERLKNIDRQFRHCVQAAGIEDFRIHDLRHTFASWLAMREVPLLHVKELLGHSSIKMTERYAHLSTTALVKAVAVLDSP